MRNCKKVYILTYYYADNYGAVLQAYALAKYIRQVGFDPVFVKYIAQPPSLLSYLSSPRVLMRKIFSNYAGFLRKLRLNASRLKTSHQSKYAEKFQDFRSRYLSVTEKSFTFDDLMEGSLVAHAFIVGSDQVWSLDFVNGDRVYLLDFPTTGATKISYAASFGKQKLEGFQKPVFSKCLERFDYVSVREETGLNIVRGVGVDDAKCCLDPTLLNDNYDELLEDLPLRGRYILFYQLSGDDSLVLEQRALVGQVAVELGLEVVSVMPGSTAPLNENFTLYAPAPDEFVGLIRDAEFVITNSFHGMVFSTIFRKNFVVLPRDRFKDKQNLRMIEFLREYSLDYAYYSGLNSEKLKAIISKSHDFTCYLKKLSHNRTQSECYLAEALGIAQ